MAIKNKTENQGFTLIEIALSVGIIGLALVSLSQFTMMSMGAVNQAKQKEKVLMLAREGMDAVRNFRDNTTWGTNGIGSLTAGSLYHPAITRSGATTTYSMISGAETLGSFSRQIVFQNVSRDSTTAAVDTVYNAARNDADTRLVTVTVTFDSDNYAFSAYLTNWH